MTIATKSTQPETGDHVAYVHLSTIQLSKTNEMFRGPADVSDAGLKELADSIKAKGLLQPILLRAHGNGSYILVAGERRFRACKLLGIDTVPAFIKDMTEEEAFELQITENLQRSDVHPLKEAKAFKALIEERKWTTAELAARFGKGETYILQRLRLNTMVPEAAKDFAANRMTLAQAIVIARLNPEDQKMVVDRCSGKTNELDLPYYQSVQELEDFIAEEITHDLSKAPFDVADTKIVPKAGACTTCPKRSGAQSLLFSDVQQKDRCFDPKCFKAKRAIGVFNKISQLVEEKPDTIFIEERGWRVEKPDPKILSLLKDSNVKYLPDNAWQSYGYGDTNKKVKAIVVNGPDAGKPKDVYIKGKSTAAAKDTKKGEEKAELTAAERKEAIERIRERSKRNAELDQEKVYWRIIETLQKSKHMKGSVIDRPQDIDKVMMRWIIMQHSGYDKQYLGGFSVKGTPQQQIQTLFEMPDEIFAQITRKIMLKHYAGPASEVHNTAGQILWRLAEKLPDVPVDQFIKEQTEIATKREERAAQRIAQLSEKPKKATPKKTNK